MKKRINILIIIISLVSIIGVTLTFAYLTKKENKVIENDIGQVIVKPELYFQNGTNKIPGEVLNIYGTANNPFFVYKVNVTNHESDYHINKLRLDFKVNSNIDTYFRIRIINTLSVTRTDSTGKTNDYALGTEKIDYGINNESNWFDDIYSNWLYFKNKDIDNSTINYIVEGLNYDLKSVGHFIKLMIQVEAVQGHLGPKENWNMDLSPWGDEW